MGRTSETGSRKVIGLDAHKLCLSEASRLIRVGELSPTELLEALLSRIDQLESKIKAWVTVDEERARATADRLTKEAEAGRLRGPLHGIPIGIKDIYYTRNLKTTMGSPLYEGFVPDHDAESVASLRRAGAVILGKTETTEFAASDPAPTRNPWNLEHTPGGSSSGSAAAVSSGMCPAALGSQTGGSVIRPAAYCGVVGLKPTYDRISRHGVYPLSWSLDHVGFFTRAVKDSAIVLEALSGRGNPSSDDSLDEVSPPRFGLLRGYFQDFADEEVWEGFEDAVERLRDAGAEVVEPPLPSCFTVVHAAHRVIMASEAASVHEENFKEKRSKYRVNMRGLIASGLMVQATSYIRAQRIRGKFIRETAATLKDIGCLLTPSATTPAPHGLEYTGDPAFNSPWSFCGFPSITVPSGLTQYGLPLGIQLIAGSMQENRLLTDARWCENIIEFQKTPLNPNYLQ